MEEAKKKNFDHMSEPSPIQLKNLGTFYARLESVGELPSERKGLFSALPFFSYFHFKHEKLSVFGPFVTVM